MADSVDTQAPPVLVTPFVPAESAIRDDGPIPLSFPAVLRNPGVSSRFSHIRAEHLDAATPARKTTKRDDKDGKRWSRRRENAHFVGNPHIVLASKADYALQLPRVKSTFPKPLPSYLQRTAKLPDTVKPTLEPYSANAGRFSLSLKGMRRELRKAGFRAQTLVQDVEHELTDWLQGGAFAPLDGSESSRLNFPGIPIGRIGNIFEISRTPLQLIWSVPDDAFARYVVHCCARYHEVVSFSREVSDRRLTYLLRPNVTRPDSLAMLGLDTPPISDLDTPSHFETDTESDVLSDALAETMDSDAENSANSRILSSIPETSPRLASDNDWSVVEGSDIEGDESAHEGDITASIQSLSLQSPEPRSPLDLRAPVSFRSRQWKYRQDRSASSPSRSPVRRTPRRRIKRSTSLRQNPNLSFFDYLFA